MGVVGCTAAVPLPAVLPELDGTAAGAALGSALCAALGGPPSLDVQRANPTCAGCHALIDPLGFALENFDAVGAWREFDAGGAVDASGRLPDGAALAGVGDLRAALLANPRAFASTVVEKLMVYALGRGLTAYDMPVVRGILREAEDDDYRFEAIVLGVIESPAFRTRVKASDDAAVARAD